MTMLRIHRNLLENWPGLLVLLIGSLLIGCSTSSERYNPHYAAYRQTIRRVLLLPPQVGVFVEMPGGKILWQDEASQTAQQFIQRAVVHSLAAHQFSVRMADAEMIGRSDVRNVQALFRSVNRAIQLHTYGPQLFPTKQRAFEYGVGSVADILAQGHADALVLVVGHQTLSQSRPKSWVSIAVIEPGGKIIWYSMQGALKDLKLQTRTGASTLVSQTLQNFVGVQS